MWIEALHIFAYDWGTAGPVLKQDCIRGINENRNGLLREIYPKGRKSLQSQPEDIKTKPGAAKCQSLQSFKFTIHPKNGVALDAPSVAFSLISHYLMEKITLFCLEEK